MVQISTPHLIGHAVLALPLVDNSVSIPYSLPVLSGVNLNAHLRTTKSTGFRLRNVRNYGTGSADRENLPDTPYEKFPSQV